jgi:hypothetical protein
MEKFDADDLSVLATLAENPSLSRSSVYADFLNGLKPELRRLAEAIVSEGTPGPSSPPQKTGARKTTPGAGKKAAVRKSKTRRSKPIRKTAADKSAARSTSTAKKRARSILKWANENRSRRK